MKVSGSLNLDVDDGVIVIQRHHFEGFVLHFPR